MDYRQLYDEAVRIWKEHKSAEPAVHYVEAQLTSIPPGVLQGRVRALLGLLQKRLCALPDALVSHREAASMLVGTPHYAEVLVSQLDVHVDLHQIEDGYRTAFEAEVALAASEEDTRRILEPIMLCNSGRLSLLHGDWGTAKTRLEQSVTLFATTGRNAEACRTRVFLAESLIGLGELADAEVMCNDVRGCEDAPAQALIEANLLLSKIAVAHQNLSKAAAAIDRARIHMAEQLGKRDWRLLVTIIRAEADLDSARGNKEGANRLHSLLSEWTGSGNPG